MSKQTHAMFALHILAYNLNTRVTDRPGPPSQENGAKSERNVGQMACTD